MKNTTTYEPIKTQATYTLRDGETIETIVIHTPGGQVDCPSRGVTWDDKKDYVTVTTELLVTAKQPDSVANAILKSQDEQLYDVFDETMTDSWGVGCLMNGKRYRMRSMTFAAPTYSEALQLAQTRALADIDKITARLETRNERLALREARAKLALVGMPFKAVETETE